MPKSTYTSPRQPDCLPAMTDNQMTRVPRLGATCTPTGTVPFCEDTWQDNRITLSLTLGDKQLSELFHAALCPL
ncbi:unnamed protein product [Nezara viridula]|uniref:Uncharacterized protein n=1 Tax=Nezara viridula TaxID=85310 RepID=A0A9P0E509_NEZVI|nr:unnamed protein product [Nezara viridula]